MAIAPSEPGAGSVRSVNAALMPYALSAALYPSGEPPMPVGSVRACVAAPWTWQTSRRTDFIIHRDASSYQQSGRVVVPDLAPYLHRLLRKPLGYDLAE